MSTDGTSRSSRSAAGRQHAGLASIDAERYDAAAAVGGWRGVLESALPTAVFVLIMALRPSALLSALLAAMVVSSLALLLRLLQRQGLTQVLGGCLLVVVSAVWAWRSGRAENFYLTGLLVNGAWLTVCLASLTLRWPLVGLLMGLWNASSGHSSESHDSVEQEAGDVYAVSESRAPGSGSAWTAWRTDPAQQGLRRRYWLATVVLSTMFALRLGVEVPLYLAGSAGLGALGVARLALGLPLFALTLWFVWLLVRPRNGHVDTL